MELHITAQLKQHPAQLAVAAYLDRLPLSAHQRDSLLPSGGAVEVESDTALRAMHGSLAAEAAGGEALTGSARGALTLSALTLSTLTLSAGAELASCIEAEWATSI